MNLSASKVDCFYGCQRLYWFRYVKKFPAKESKYFAIGNIAHKALELFHKSEDRSMGSAFKEAYAKEKVEFLLAKELITKADLLSIKEMLANYLAHYKKSMSDGSVHDTAFIEKQFRFDIEPGVTVWGRADRVDTLRRLKEHSCSVTYEVVDYKTSQSVMKQKEIDESVQLPTYALWLRSLYGNSICVAGKYMFLKMLNTKGIIVVPIDEQAIEKAKNKYTEVNAFLLKNITIEQFEKNRKYKYCGLCEHKLKCLES